MSKEHIDRVGIEFYSRWKEFQLKNVASFSQGIQVDPKDQKEVPFDNSVRFIRIVDFTKGTNEELRYIDNPGERYLVEEDDLVMIRYGSQTAGKIARGFKGAIANNTFKISLNEDILNKNFVFYFLSQKSVFDYFHLSQASSTMPAITFDMIGNLDLLVPPIQEQTAIASILSSLDDKIDLLHRQNKTLEQLAETLFRQWFVEEAEESWEVEKLGKVFDIGIGRTPPRKEQHWFTLNPNDVKWVSIKDMGTSGIYIDTVSEYLTPQAVEQYSVPVIPENTVMLSFKMTIGRLAISTEKMVSNEAIAHFKQKEGSSLFPEFLYLFLKTYSWVELGSTSSIVESINSQMIKDIEMAIPDEQKLNTFKDLIKPYFDKIRSNQTQIRTLTQTRDTLLPKLMSGEVRVEM
ncbi:MAG: restriction endonuclease subunit S [Paludibacter sp.]